MPKKHGWPHPFLWGASTSSHQIEGNNRANDWWAWEQAGKLKEPSGLACDHYHRFREDFDILSRLGHKAYRFSIEWSRLEPEENQWSEDGFDFYEKIFEELERRGIEPVVTLHHFTNPEWFTRKDGWLQADAFFYFTRYVNRVIERFGRHVRFWITINEPLVYLYHGFYAGLWPPGLQSFASSMRVFRHLVTAHTKAYSAIHHYYKNQLHKEVWVSLAMHLSHFTPCRAHSLLDRWVVWLRHWFANDVFLRAVTSGFLFFPGIFCEFLHIKNCLDFIGVNYYTRDFVRFSSLGGIDFIGSVCDKEHHKEQVQEKNMMGWEVYADGLYEVLRDLRKYHLPVLITENGLATLEDSQRARFIKDHLNAVRRAREEHVPVAGYFYWSLLDNFEWAHGFEPRFGIVHVDYQTQERIIRESAQVLSEMCRKIESEK